MHPKGTSYGRPHWAIRGACPHWAIRAGRSTPFRSALEPNIHYSRSLLYDRCGGVMFPVAFIQSAGNKVFLRVQSERSERLRELHEVQGSRELAPWRGSGASSPGQVWGAGVQWTPLSRRLRSADRAGRRDPAARAGARRLTNTGKYSIIMEVLCSGRRISRNVCSGSMAER